MISHTFLLIVIFLAPTLHHAGALDAISKKKKLFLWRVLDMALFHSRFPPYFFIHSFINFITFVRAFIIILYQTNEITI